LTLEQLVESTARRFRAAKLHYGHGTTNAEDEAAFPPSGAALAFDSPQSEAIPAGSVKRIESLIRKRIEKRIPVAYLLNDGRRPFVLRRPASSSPVTHRVHAETPGKLACSTWQARAPRHPGVVCFSGRASIERFVPRCTRGCGAERQAFHLQKRIRLIHSDLFESIRGEYDLILSNPPYVSASAMRKLPAEYRYEPGLALAGGQDGLVLIRKILEQAPAHLARRGQLVCEVGDGRRALARPALRWPLDEVFVCRKVG
jgi:ribosomal protein L3 glutamine methyltransferase